MWCQSKVKHFFNKWFLEQALATFIETSLQRWQQAVCVCMECMKMMTATMKTILQAEATILMLLHYRPSTTKHHQTHTHTKAKVLCCAWLQKGPLSRWQWTLNTRSVAHWAGNKPEENARNAKGDVLSFIGEVLPRFHSVYSAVRVLLCVWLSVGPQQGLALDVSQCVS